MGSAVKGLGNSRSLRLFMILLICLVVAVAVCYVGMQDYEMRLNERINKLRQDIESSQAKMDALELEIADLRKGSRIRKIAREQLGMKMPDGAPEKLF